MAIRVLIADDNALMRDGLVRLLSDREGIEVVGSCCDGDELLARVKAEGPDVVVTDIRMPPSGSDEGIRAAAHLRLHHPAVGVVVLSQYLEPEYALALLDGGSNGRAYLLKERVSDPAELVSAVREVAAGGSVVDAQVVDALVGATTAGVRSGLSQLTPRETDVLQEMATGKSNAAIAAALVLSERAIEKHSNSIFSKLALSEEVDVNRRVKAVLLYLAGTGAA